MTRSWLNYLVIFSQLLFNPPALSAQVVVATTRTRNTEVAAYLRAFPEAKPFSQVTQESRPGEHQLESLITAFAQAKASFFKDSQSLAKEQFASVLAMQHLAQWQRQQQYVFLHSALRLHELAQSNDEKEKYIAEAARLGYYLDIDQTVFSPKTVASFQTAKQKIKVLTLPITGWLRGFTSLHYNGQSLDLRGKASVKIIDGEYLFGFHSDRYLPWETVLGSRDLLVIKHNNQPLAHAGCQLHHTLSKLPEVVIIDQQSLCGESRNQLGPQVLPREPEVQTKTLVGASLKPKTTQAKNINLDKKMDAVHSATQRSPETKSKWWQSKWLWVGLSVGAAYYIHQNSLNSGGGSSNNNRNSAPADTKPTVSYEK